MKKLIFFLLLLKFDFNSEAQGTFQKTYGGGTAYSVKKTNDGNLVMTGDPCFLTKMDQNGSVLWRRNYSVSGGMIGNAVEKTADGGYIIVGESNPGPAGKVALFKTDSNGYPQWSKTYGGTYYESGRDVKQTLDGGYIVVGTTKSFGISFDDIYVIKTNSAGNLQWSKTIADTPIDDVDVGSSVVEANDGGYVVCGRMRNNLNGGYSDMALIKFDQNGNLQWFKEYGDQSNNEEGNSIISTSDGGYAISGNTESFGSGGTDVLLVKTDANGSLQWNISFGGTGYDYGRFVKELSDGSFVTGGATESFGAGMYDFYLTKFDSNGIFDWTKTFGGTSYDHGYSAEETSDKGFVIVGNAPSFNNEIYVVKTDSSGYSGCNEFTPNMSMTLASVTVSTPSVVISSPPTVVNVISFAVSSVSTENTLCSLVAVPEVRDDQFIIDDAELIGIYDLLGREVRQVYPDNIYIYQYADKKGQSFFKKEMIVR